MPVFRLPEELIFPDPGLAEKNGLLAVGGDLSEDRLLLAYSMGIFPWYSDGSPILWWSPDPRLVLLPGDLIVSRSLRQVIKKGIFTITMNTAFEEVIRNCSEIDRRGQDGTWITEEMVDAYIRLHRAGYAHSVESWHDGELAGGLYGIALGKAFFGESMFAKKSNASKVAFVTLVENLCKLDYHFIDCQVTTEHLKRLGAKEVSRKKFLVMLKRALQ
ncbi:MAG: leucyl/phenylalanyl-tRNA--protein transferase [Nitrospiraceae bacterium]|jgi:leucyl/phenylalanyl-tRNA---protein transferase|nr:MAG: leucyl/phenylalanyl-tRNA--protein transferase [Nitrospiraceae bacterium]